MVKPKETSGLNDNLYKMLFAEVNERRSFEVMPVKNQRFLSEHAIKETTIYNRTIAHPINMPQTQK
ncbi:hypothetical protein EB241_18190 [Erwinia psidii]|uniref:Uncharacterized protein n=1 Tax=Erwinia psidii TaxID=69224 RepID=A0A3N6SE42_9GAMM|nr:hypothetical protein EB241_18190 [Erwinia psidii]